MIVKTYSKKIGNLAELKEALIAGLGSRSEKSSRFKWTYQGIEYLVVLGISYLEAPNQWPPRVIAYLDLWRET